MRSGILAAVAMVALVGAAQADNLLGVAPLRLILNDNKTSDMLTLVNRSEDPHTYKVVTQDEVMSEQGQILQKDDFAYSAKRMLRFMPRVVTLQGGERQNIRVMAEMPEGLADGDYHTHLILEEVKPERPQGVSGTVAQGFKVSMGTLYSVGLPVVVQHGKISSALKLTDVKMATEEGKPVFKVGIDRTGNAESSAMVMIVDKATQANVGQPTLAHIYREVDHVTLTVNVLPKILEAGKTKALEAKLVSDGKVLGIVDVKN